jgi:hypothetical protein
MKHKKDKKARRYPCDRKPVPCAYYHFISALTQKSSEDCDCECHQHKKSKR